MPGADLLISTWTHLQVVGQLLPPLRLEDPLSLAASISTSPQRSPHHRSPQRSPTLRATGASAVFR